VFLGPLVGITITDYFVVRNGNVWVTDLYTSNPSGRYWYTYGVNWRAIIAFSIAVVLPIPGFSALFGQKLAIEWSRIYSVGWLIGCVLSSVIYFALCTVGNWGIGEEERGMEWEEVAKTERVIVGTYQEEAASGSSVVFESVVVEEKKN